MGSVVIECSNTREVKIVREFETVDFSKVSVDDLPLPPVEEKEKSE